MMAFEVCDHYARSAKKDGFRSRASYKLREIQQRDSIVRSGNRVVDLGSTPGGWSQLLVDWVGKQGQVFAIDQVDMEPIDGVTFINGDFSRYDVIDQLLASGQIRGIDVVLSDMAPNLSGIKVTDQARCMHLCESAWLFSEQVLKVGGIFLVKIFQGEGVNTFKATLKSRFKQVVIRKPKASRSQSAEVYCLAKYYLG